MLALGKAANLGLVATSPKQNINITIGNASSLVDLLTMKTKKPVGMKTSVRLRANIV